MLAWVRKAIVCLGCRVLRVLSGKCVPLKRLEIVVVPEKWHRACEFLPDVPSVVAVSVPLMSAGPVVVNSVGMQLILRIAVVALGEKVQPTKPYDC